MKKSNHWHIQAKQLCNELTPEDGVDPRQQRKNERINPDSVREKQLSKRAKQVISTVIECDLNDPLFDALYVADVSSNSDGRYLWVTIESNRPITLSKENLILQRFDQIQGYLRSAVARSVNRKRVPGLKFRLVISSNQEI